MLRVWQASGTGETKGESVAELVGGQRPDLNLCAESRSCLAKIYNIYIYRTLQALQQLKGPLLSPSVNHETVCQAAKDDRM
ncbi:hypothetical protein ACRRTK_001415 [Alexandromys fortis]